MASRDWTVTGASDVGRGLQRADAAMKAEARSLVAQAGATASALAKANVESQRKGHGRKPGSLHRGINAKTYGLVAVVAGRAPHTHLFELGTEPHQAGPRHHPGARAKPSIYPAAERAGRPLLRAFETRLARAGEDAWNRSR